MLCATFCATISRAQSQDVAEAARQERARKEEHGQKSTKHVYTNEDLAHAKILTPEDRAQVEARKNECAQKNNCSPSENSPAKLDANSGKPGTSLGEIARQYRKQKQQQKELDALKPKQSEPFHLPMGTPALASPVLPERPLIRRPSAPVVHPEIHSHVMRRDPFAVVPLHPARPKVRSEISPKANAEIRNDARKKMDGRESRSEVPRNLFDIRPNDRQHTRSIAPRQPKFSLQPAPRNFVTETIQPAAPARPTALAPTTKVVPVEVEKARPSQPASTIRSGDAPRTVTVQRGDSLWKLAQQSLGNGSHWPELLALNPWIANANQIRIGASLTLPSVDAKPRTTRNASRHPSNVIKVRKGDTLWSLAKTNLGRSAYWPCLAAANPGLNNPNRIDEGQELLLPSACHDSSRGSLLRDER